MHVYYNLTGLVIWIFQHILVVEYGGYVIQKNVFSHGNDKNCVPDSRLPLWLSKMQKDADANIKNNEIKIMHFH